MGILSPTPFLKEGEKASQKDEFQNRKTTVLIIKPSRLNRELLKVAKWKMSGFGGTCTLLNMRITTSRDGVRIKSRSRKRGAEQGPGEDPFAQKGPSWS